MARFMRCDQCKKETPETRTWQNSLGPDYSWIVVECNEDSDHAQLCSWGCLAEYAMTKALDSASATSEDGAS